MCDVIKIASNVRPRASKIGSDGAAELLWITEPQPAAVANSRPSSHLNRRAASWVGGYRSLDGHLSVRVHKTAGLN